VLNVKKQKYIKSIKMYEIIFCSFISFWNQTYDLYYME